MSMMCLQQGKCAMANPAEDMARILAQGRRPRRRWLWLLLAALVLATAGLGLWL